MSNLAAPESSLSPSSPGTNLPSTGGSHFYFVRLLISWLSPEDADNLTLWESQSLNISFYMLKKKIKALKALAISLTLRLLVLVVWSHVPGVSMQHHFSDHAASSERSCFWFSGWYQYEKCCRFPQIRYRKLKHPQGRFNRTDLQDSFGYKTPHSNGQVHTSLSKMDNQRGPAA